MNSVRSIVVLAVLLALLAPAIAAGAASIPGTQLTVSTQTFKTSFMIELANKTVVIPANSSVTIDVNVPSYLNATDVAAIHVVAENITGEIQLKAYAGNNTVATSTIVPLSSTYHQTLPPSTTKIVLSSTAAANATIKVYLQTTDAKFELTLEKNSITLEKGGTAKIAFTLKQVSGPGVWVWPLTQSNEPLSASVYRNTSEGPVHWNYQTGILMRAGDEETGYIEISWPVNRTATSTTADVKVYFWADTGEGPTPESAQLVASVDLSGVMSGVLANMSVKHATNNKYVSFGIGAVVAFILAFLLLGKGGKGRRGTADGMAIVVLILVALAAVGFTAGLVNFNPHVQIDYKYLGVGILAILALIILIRQGAVPAPHSIKKLFK